LPLPTETLEPKPLPGASAKTFTTG
jgi:hypothetical protein